MTPKADLKFGRIVDLVSRHFGADEKLPSPGTIKAWLKVEKGEVVDYNTARKIQRRVSAARRTAVTFAELPVSLDIPVDSSEVPAMSKGRPVAPSAPPAPSTIAQDLIWTQHPEGRARSSRSHGTF